MPVLGEEVGVVVGTGTDTKVEEGVGMTGAGSVVWAAAGSPVKSGTATFPPMLIEGVATSVGAGVASVGAAGVEDAPVASPPKVGSTELPPLLKPSVPQVGEPISQTSLASAIRCSSL